MKIVLTEQDIHRMVKETVEMILEGNVFGLLCYYPYRVSLAFTDHAIEREWRRSISEHNVAKDIESVIGQIIEDYDNGSLQAGEKEGFKVVDRDSCRVSVCYPEPNKYNPKQLWRITVGTVYVWDGKMNYKNTRNEKIYYINEPSEKFIEATEWNEEHQDLVGPYTRWKHSIDIKKQRERAEYIQDLAKPFITDEVPSQMRLHRVKKAMEDERRKKMDDIYNEMDPEDYEAIRDYDLKMDYVPLASKGSANRDLRAMDLMKQRKDLERQRKFYGDKVNDVPDDELLKYPKAVGKIKLSPQDLNKKRFK